MSTPDIKTFGVHTLQLLYQFYGYEELLREVEKIHYINTRTFSKPTYVPEHAEQKNEMIVPVPVVEHQKENDVKQIVMKPNASAEQSVELSDEERCTAKIRNGKARCAVRIAKKSGNYRMCYHHYTLLSKQSAEEQEGDEQDVE